MLEAGRKGALVGMEQVFGPCCSKGTGTASDQGLSCFEVPAQNATHQGTGALQLTHQNALRATHWFTGFTHWVRRLRFMWSSHPVAPGVPPSAPIKTVIGHMITCFLLHLGCFGSGWIERSFSTCLVLNNCSHLHTDNCALYLYECCLENCSDPTC